MSRWDAEFSGHPFQGVWKALKDALAPLEVDDQTVPTSVEELARLKRVIVYLDEMINGVDPSLTPKSVWGTFQPQADACLQQISSYASNRNIAHIVQANEHADNLLTYLKPYFVLPGSVIAALKASTDQYAATIEEYVASLGNKATSLINQLDENKKKSESYVSKTESKVQRIDQFTATLFVGTPEKPSIESDVLAKKAAIDAQAIEISDLHSSLLVGDASTKTSVAKAETDIQDSRNKITNLLTAADAQIAQLGEFYKKIFGEKDPKTGKIGSGLQFELDERMGQLDAVETEQKTRHDALYRQIEALLPGATSAGLASAYKIMKESFSKPIQRYTQFFYGSLGLLVLAAIVMSIKQITLYPTASLEFIEIGPWDYVLKALLYKAPFVGPVVWLALFSSTRRSQYERLQQEYAHKEAIATSYDSYKTQLQQLSEKSGELQKDLIMKAIDAIAYNASVTLDGKHGDKMPIHQIVEKMSITDLQKLADMLKTVS